MKIVVFALFITAHCELTLALSRQHYFINQAKTWNDARQYCMEKYDDLSSVDNLASIWDLRKAIDTDSNTTVSTLFYSKQIWIGLNKISSARWQWSDGTPNPDVWAYNGTYPNLCVISQDVQLIGINCSNQQPFYCYKWDSELIFVKENKSWEDALEHCRTHYTDLASLPTNSHLTQADQTITITDTRSVWTGLRFLTGLWFWVSGEALGNLVQVPSCPANRFNCGARNKTAKSWENRDCMDKLYFLCY